MRRTLAIPAIMAFLLIAAPGAMTPKPMVADLLQRGVISGMLNSDFPIKSETGTKTGEALPPIATLECCPKRANVTQIGQTSVISLLLDRLIASRANLQSL